MVGWKRIYYPGFSQALDFGAFSGVKLLSSQATLLGYRLVYETFDFYDTPGREAGDNFANTLRYYQAALLGQNFIHTVVDDLYLGTYKTDTEGLEILATLTGNKTIDVSVWRVPQFYAEYPQLPDFGWYAFLETLAGAQEYDDATEYVYNWSDYYTFDEFMYLLEDYTYLLELSGYELQDSNSTKLLYSGNGEVVMLILQSTKFCVAVLKL
ncbi:hypothetical protein SDC9_133209 [bioreactor metagenome]|uniref:Uncharacterized protein n=1 Tax=bioreactor metagenome TaxID=1076179 RepID=A0A645D9N3_9ZZZZ